MRKIYYQESEEVEPGVYMHINYMNNTVILLDKYAHDFYEGFYDGEPPATNPELLKIFNALRKSNFIVDDNYNEKERVKWRKVKETFDATMYHLVINPTLDCNLSCWYCYEHKYKESKLNGAGFKVDYYTQGKLCFAERYNEAVINYDGNVFKCTTIPDFNLKDSYGKLDLTSGKIFWDESKRASDYDSPTPEHCLSCKRYPICYGPCPNQINVGHTACYLDSLNMSRKEYFQYIAVR